MVYNFIKSVLDSKGYNSSQDTPLGELLDTAEQHFVYTADGEVISDMNMGSLVIDNQQTFKIYGVTSDLYDGASQDDMGIALMGIYKEMRARLPASFTDTNGSHKITDVINPAVTFVGVDKKTLRVTELRFVVLWSYNYGNI